MKSLLNEHYRRLADSYNGFLFYSPEFIRTLSAKMVEKLDLRRSDVLVDLGGGTGMYSLAVRERVHLEQLSYCVDPYPEMLDQIPAKAPIKPVCMDALAFSEEVLDYNKVLVKEAVHHIKDRELLFSNLYQRLPRGGRMLLVHVPPNVQYPLFQKALERARHWHANPDELIIQLKKAGFEVERDFLDYVHRIPKKDYFKQVEACFMSVLSSFSEGEMRAGLVEMEEKYGDQDHLEFIDHFDYLTAVKA